MSIELKKYWLKMRSSWGDIQMFFCDAFTVSWALQDDEYQLVLDCDGAVFSSLSSCEIMLNRRWSDNYVYTRYRSNGDLIRSESIDGEIITSLVIDCSVCGDSFVFD